MVLHTKTLLEELQFKAVRSSGPGGQHANKVASKVEVTWSISESMAVTDKEKELLLAKLARKLTKEGLLILQCDTHRSQHKNKDEVVARLLMLLKKSLTVPKKRKPSRPTRSSIEKRLKSKKKAAQKKANRKPPEL